MTSYKLNVEFDSYKGEKEQNQDAIVVDKDAGIFIVADGCSGHSGRYASEEASDFVATELRRIIARSPSDGQDFYFTEYMKDTLLLANQKLLMYGTRKKLEEIPKTTLDAVVLRENNLFCFAHVGDSSIYAVTEDRVIKLTEDQSTVAEQRKKNKLDEDQAKVFYSSPSEPINYLGNPKMQRDGSNESGGIQAESIEEPQRIVMLTDGLTDICTKAELEQLMLNYSGRKLIEKAYQMYAGPEQIYEVKLREDKPWVLKFISDQQDERFKEAQQALVGLESSDERFAKISDYLSANPGFKKLVIGKMKENLKLGQNDNFSIIVIEPKTGFKLRWQK
jgi:serine/threonine protein phosphatase PrpC